jgi:hypothetical protein
VNKEKLAQISNLIEERLKQSVKLPLTEAIRVIEAQGVSDASCALTQLGYKITWRGINSEQAEVTKTTQKNDAKDNQTS